MRTFKLLTAFAVLSATQSNAQIFGQAELPHNTSYVTSAKITNITPTQGYVIAGYSPITSGTGPDFVIDHLDNNFAFTATTDFSRQYRITDKTTIGANCSPTARTYNCGGVDIVETNSFSNARYAIAGIYNRGVFFALLTSGGAPIAGRWFRWDLLGVASSFKRPRIRESLSNPGQFYICGYANGYSYAMRVNANGATPTSMWAKRYTMPTSGIIARDLIESPYGAQDELIIVGRIDIPSAGTAADAFFMSVDENSGTVNYLSHYDKQFTGDDWWSCIELATDPQAPGFIVGGRSVHPINSGGPQSYHYSQWMAKLDANGGMYWSHLIWPQGISAGTMPGSEICDVFERVNPSSTAVSPYEYYGVAGNYSTPLGGPNNLTVYKLDRNGSDLSFNPDQFHFLYGTSAFLGTSIYDDAQITQLQTGGTNDGIQVYGTDVNDTYHDFEKAYFNGVSGCEEPANILRVLQGPTYVNSISITDVNMLFPCQTSFALQSTAPTIPVNTSCPFTSNPTGGSNAKQIAAGISENRKNTAEIYPNPVSDKAFVTYPADAAVKIEVFNTMGQKVNVPVRAVEQGKAELDFAGAKVSGGVYFIHVSSGQEIVETKVIYTKD